MKKNQLKLTPWMIVRRGHYLYFLYYWIYGLIQDYKMAGRSLSHTIFNKQENAFPVQSISYPYIKALVRCIDFSADDVFVDVGCAWGRLLKYLCYRTNIQKLIGVELNQEAAQFAQNISKSESRITIIAGDILQNIPEEGTVFYLFNPFGEDVMRKFLEIIENKITHSVRILYLYPTCRKVIEENCKWRLVEEKKVKPKNLGELELCVYEKV